MARPSAVYPPEIWAMESLLYLTRSQVVANLVHRNFEDEVAQKGDTVNTRLPTAGSIETISNTVSNQVNFTAQAATNVAIVLDTHIATSFAVTDRDMSTSIKNLITEFVEPYTDPISEKVDDDLLGYLDDIDGTAGTSAYHTVTTSGVDLSLSDSSSLILGDFANIRGKLRENKCPRISPDTVSIVLGTQHETEALKIDNFIRVDTFGDNPPAMKTGYLTQVYGMGVYADQGVAKVGLKDVSVAFHRDAIALVTRPLESPPVPTVTAASVSLNGVGMRAIMSYHHEQFATRMSYDILYGIKVLNFDLGCVLIDAVG